MAPEQLLALRNLAHRLKSELQVRTSTSSCKEAMVWLVETALDCAIDPKRAAEAFRTPRSRVLAGAKMDRMPKI
jgi:hypothetical protein